MKMKSLIKLIAIAVLAFSLPSCHLVSKGDFCHPKKQAGYVKQTGGHKWQNPAAPRPRSTNKYVGR
jgi:hypothetical protein